MKAISNFVVATRFHKPFAINFINIYICSYGPINDDASQPINLDI